MKNPNAPIQPGGTITRAEFSALARDYSKRGWGEHETRKDWEESLRFKGTMTLPKEQEEK